ncbi:Ig-like domain-containing protein [Parvibaculum sp.]|uniref:Ig-like domain-containing protein n=1 Tax=Parvibaculum sp. TaxID=2024848 RepID=UPI003BAB2F27
MSLPAVGYDYAGNESGESGALTVTIDDTAPPVPVITAISEDTGFSATDKQTSDTTPTITGTAEAGSTVRILINGGFCRHDGRGRQRRLVLHPRANSPTAITM